MVVRFVNHARLINHVWTCEMCNSRANKVRATKCDICGHPAPKTVFGLWSHGRYVIVRLLSVRNAAVARIYDPKTDERWEEELAPGDDLDVRVEGALRRALDDAFREQAARDAPRAASRARRGARGRVAGRHRGVHAPTPPSPYNPFAIYYQRTLPASLVSLPRTPREPTLR